jgi:putative addiction module component (TIGR02574 family)
MPDLVADLSLQARLLPPEDRVRLAEELLASLDPHVSDVELAWEQEIRRRVAEVEQGLVELIPAKAAFAKVRSTLRA